MVLDLEPPPGMISWRDVNLPPFLGNGLFALPDRPLCYFASSGLGVDEAEKILSFTSEDSVLRGTAAIGTLCG